MQPTESTYLKYGKCTSIHTHTHPYTTTHMLTVHIHSQSKGVRSCNIACCNLVHSTVITSDVSNVKLVAVTVNLGSVAGTPFLVSVRLSRLELASSGREKVNSCPSAGVAVAVVHENHGEQWWSSGGQREHNPV